MEDYYLKARVHALHRAFPDKYQDPEEPSAEFKVGSVEFLFVIANCFVLLASNCYPSMHPHPLATRVGRKFAEIATAQPKPGR